MKILYVDTGLFGAVALRLAEEGNQVYYYSVWESAHPRDADVLYGRGWVDAHPKVTRIDNWHGFVDKVDLIVFPDVFSADDVEGLLKAGYKVFGVRPKGALLENERTFAKKEFSHLHYPRMRQFKDIPSAVKYIEEKFEANDRVVVKLSGGLRGSYVSYARDDAIDFIKDHESEAEGVTEVSIIVQKYIAGVEVAVGAWASPHFPLLQFGWNMNFEHKKKMPGDIGPMTGEMGTVLFWADVYDTNKLIQETLTPMSSWIRRNYGAHYIDINLIIEERTGKIYVVEFTSRFGTPHILITLPLLESDMGSLMWSMVTGQETDVKYDTRVAVGIGVTVAGYPNLCAINSYAHKKFRIKYPSDRNKEKYFVPSGVYKTKEDKKNEFRVLPEHGRTIVTVGVGDTLPEAQLMAVDYAQRVLLQDAEWRYDIGDRLYAQAPFLLERGFLSTERAKQFMPGVLS